MASRYLIIVGTRPEVIKMAPIIRECVRIGQDPVLVHTGQHYSHNMDEIFWQDLKLPKPQFRLNTEIPKDAGRIDDLVIRVGEVFNQVQPNWVLVHGDTNSTLAGALAAKKHPAMRLAHVEAGLRSFDQSMPEEVNRIVVDHISDMLFAPTNEAILNLNREGISAERIQLVGNTIEDELRLQMYHVRHSKQGELAHHLTEKPYGLLTLHRAENTASKIRLKEILTAVFDGFAQKGLNLLFSVHPRTQILMHEMQIEVPDHVGLLGPLGYVQFLTLMSNAKLIATDSGGLQEEACILGKPCVTLRENTERPETIDIGANILAGVTRAGIIDAILVSQTDSDLRTWISPYGGGLAAANIVSKLEATFSVNSRLTEIKRLDPDMAVLGIESQAAAFFERSNII